MIRRPRRLRVTKQIRDLVHETSIDKTDLIYPMFIIDVSRRYSVNAEHQAIQLTDLPSALDEVVSAGVGLMCFTSVFRNKR